MIEVQKELGIQNMKLIMDDTHVAIYTSKCDLLGSQPQEFRSLTDKILRRVVARVDYHREEN